MNTELFKSKAFQLVLLFGFVSLFADIVYEGARSISGQYLSFLGANSVIIASVAGFGELIGYAFRIVSGYISDRTKKYWFLTILGYAVNLISVPLMALTNHWIPAATLMILERFGKSIRTPARDAMLSFATKQVGRGKGFGIHMAMDQIGSVVGPVAISVMLMYQKSYAFCFALLSIPALFSIGTLLIAKWMFPRPQDLEISTPSLHSKGLSKAFWIYTLAASLVAAGYADFPLIAFHFQKDDVVSIQWIPIFFAIGMGFSGLSALCCGLLYDSFGIIVLVAVTILSTFFAPLVFFGGFYLSLLGMIFWGMGLGAQGSIMRAVIGNLVHVEKRGTAYGIFNTGFGIFWFLGSVMIGILYQTSLLQVVLFSCAMQIVAIPLFFFVKKWL